MSGRKILIRQRMQEQAKKFTESLELFSLLANAAIDDIIADLGHGFASIK